MKADHRNKYTNLIILLQSFESLWNFYSVSEGELFRKEAKESVYWLRIIEAVNPVFENEASKLLQEATELKLILSSIIEKSK